MVQAIEGDTGRKSQLEYPELSLINDCPATNFFEESNTQW